MTYGSRVRTLVLVVSAGAVLLNGCASPPRFARGAVSEAQFKQDDYQCTLDGQNAAGTRNTLMWPLPPEAHKLYAKCMESKGYTRIDK